MKPTHVYLISDLKENGIIKINGEYTEKGFKRKISEYSGFIYNNTDIFKTYKDALEGAIKKLDIEKVKIDILKSNIIYQSKQRKIKRFIKYKKCRILETIKYYKYYNEEYFPFRDNIIKSNSYETREDS